MYTCSIIGKVRHSLLLSLNPKTPKFKPGLRRKQIGGVKMISKEMKAEIIEKYKRDEKVFDIIDDECVVRL